jgi:hypothetical protein
MSFTPRPFQRHDLDLLKTHNYRGLLNQETGSGKTATGVFSHIESGSNVTLVIAPDQTHGTAWLPTLEKVGLEGRVIGNTGKAKKQALADMTLGYPGVYLATPQFLTRADVSDWSGDLILVDESHKVSAPGSKGQRKLGGFSIKDGEPLSKRFDGRMMLSGTSLRNKFELAWSISRFLWPELNLSGQVAYDNYWGWLSQWMDYKEVYTAQKDAQGQPKKVKQYYGETIPGKWLKESPLIITHFKREKCCEFHPNGFMPVDEPTVRHETIPLLPAQKKAIKEMESHMMTYLEDNPMVADIPLTQAQRIRQIALAVPSIEYVEDNPVVTFAEDCASPALDRAIDLLTDEMENECVVVFTDSQKFAAVVTARLNEVGISAFEFSGQTRGERDVMLSQLGTKYRVVVGVLAAIAEGVDGIQHVANNEIWLSRSTDETINEQAAGRTDRSGQTKQILRVYLHDDLGLSEGRFSEAVERRLLLNRSLRAA